MKRWADSRFRGFAVAFTVGGLATWPVFNAILLFMTTQELRALSNEQGSPVYVVTNPFVDFTIPGQQPIALSSFWPAVVISIFGGLFSGICALVLTILYRLIFHKKSKK